MFQETIVALESNFGICIVDRRKRKPQLTVMTLAQLQHKERKLRSAESMMPIAWQIERTKEFWNNW